MLLFRGILKKKKSSVDLYKKVNIKLNGLIRLLNSELNNLERKLYIRETGL